MENHMLKTYARKLGITSKDVVCKASEFHRMVEVRCGSSLASLNLNSSCVTVICLEIAASSSGLSTSRSSAVQLSGMQKKLYENAFKAIECVLGKQKHLTLRDMAVTFGCVSSVSSAEQLLQRFKQTQNAAIDFEQPIFGAASLYVVCRGQKARVDKSKLISHINVRRSMFDKVCKQIQAVYDKMAERSKERKSKRPYSWLECNTDEEAIADSGTKRIRISESDRKQQEDADYENWKLRVLSQGN